MASKSGASALFHQFCENILPSLELPVMSRGILDAFRNPDVTAERVGAIIEANPYYAEQLYRRIDGITGGKKERPTSADAALVQLGMQGSRNLLLALQAMRTVRGGHANWGKDGKQPAFEVSEILKFALRTEKALEKNSTENAEIGFAAGLLFDLTDLIAVQLIPEKSVLGEIRSYLEIVYAHGLKAAQAASAAGKLLPDFTLRRYLFGATLMHAVGKPLLAIANSEYLHFQNTCEEKSVPRTLRFFAEKNRFGTTHAQASMLACAGLGGFAQAERALLFYHEPFLLRAEKKTLYQLAALIRLGVNMADHPQKVEKEDDAILGLWKGKEIQELGISAKQLIGLSKKLHT